MILTHWVSWIRGSVCMLKWLVVLCCYSQLFVNSLCALMLQNYEQSISAMKCRPRGRTRPPQRDEDIVMPANVESEFVCSCIDAYGHVCGRTFPSYVQLRIHMVHSKKGTHEERPFYAKAAVTDACPWCKHKLSSKVVAEAHQTSLHARNVYKTSFCVRPRAHRSHVYAVPCV